MPFPTRRAVMLGTVCALGGCSTINALNAASEPLDTYDLFPVSGAKSGGRKPRTLMVALPQASAALATDRIMIRPDPASITYLPDARWSDELPAVIQSLLVRSISQTGRVAYVGPSGAGPVPDKALLVRVDAFEVSALGDGGFTAQVDIEMTMINDRDQRVIASRSFSQSAPIASDQPKDIVGAFQDILNGLLASMADWAIQRV